MTTKDYLIKKLREKKSGERGFEGYKDKYDYDFPLVPKKIKAPKLS